MDEKQNLRLAGGDFFVEPREFRPLPSYSWAERPTTVPLDDDELCSALVLAHGSPRKAAQLLRIPVVWLNRAIRHSLRAQALIPELNDAVRAVAESTAIDTLFDENADSRRLEWASTKILGSRLGRSSVFAPASEDAAVTIDREAREIVFRWKAPQTIEGDVASDD